MPVPFVVAFDTTYAPGELVAVAYRDGAETGRTSLRSATGAVLLDVSVDRDTIDAGDRDLTFVEVALVDAAGNVHTSVDRPVTVSVDGQAPRLFSLPLLVPAVRASASLPLERYPAAEAAP